MDAERHRDQVFATKIRGNQTYQRAYNLLLFPWKYRCFQALVDNSDLYGISSIERRKSEGKKRKNDILFFFINFSFLLF